jgi:hypothetical protein
VAQYTPIPGVAQPDLYPNLLTGVTGIIGNFGLPQPGTTGLASGLLVCTEDGIIAGLAEYLPTFVTTLVDNSKSGAIYTGCTFAYPVSDVSRPFYYAANFGNGKIDMWDSNLKPVENPAAFVDPAVPAGFAPFNIQAISDKVLLVTYAQQDTAKRKDVPGTGNGYIAAFDLNGNLLQTLVARGPLNSPWGLMIAPATFGNFAGALLVGNSGATAESMHSIGQLGRGRVCWPIHKVTRLQSPDFTPSDSGEAAQPAILPHYTLQPVSRVQTENRWDPTACLAASRPRHISKPAVYKTVRIFRARSLRILGSASRAERCLRRHGVGRSATLLARGYPRNWIMSL